MARKFTASDEVVVWAQSLSGMLTKIRREYGGPAEMVERSDWDDGKTEYVLSLIKALHQHLSQIDSELSSHVEEKFGKDQR
jgi:hypothetical protein